MTINLHNFFKFFDENNANHVDAVGILEKAIPNLLLQESDWVVTYRGGDACGGRAILKNFFLYYNERNDAHVKAITKLSNDLPDNLKSDDADWVEKYREKLPAPSILPVPYFNQVDNYRDAHRTCNSSCSAMCLEYFKPGTLKGSKGDDEFVQKVFAIGDTTDHSVQTKVLASYGIKSVFSYNLSFSNLDRELAAGRPVVIGILHRGPLSAPTGGHMVVVIGKKGDGYIVNDPYGSLNDGYQGPVSNGKGAYYSKAVLAKRWCPNGNDGWGRTFQVKK
jgi:hypothetical protein